MYIYFHINTHNPVATVCMCMYSECVSVICIFKVVVSMSMYMVEMKLYIAVSLLQPRHSHFENVFAVIKNVRSWHSLGRGMVYMSLELDDIKSII